MKRITTIEIVAELEKNNDQFMIQFRNLQLLKKKSYAVRHARWENALLVRSDKDLIEELIEKNFQISKRKYSIQKNSYLPLYKT